MSASTTVLPLISASAEAKKVSTLLTPSPVSAAVAVVSSSSERNGEGNGQTSTEGDKLVEEGNGIIPDQVVEPAPPKKRSYLPAWLLESCGGHANATARIFSVRRCGHLYGVYNNFFLTSVAFWRSPPGA